VPTVAEQITTALAADRGLGRYTFEIRVSARRKTLGMSVPAGSRTIALAIPEDATADEIVRLVKRNRDRLGALLGRANECPPDHPVKELIGGEGFEWLGRSGRLRLVDNPGPVRRVNDSHGAWMELPRTVAARRDPKPLIDWYIRAGTEYVTRETTYWWQRMAPRQTPPTVRVANIGRTRWGKYEHDTHTVTLAWQTFQLSRSLVDHVLVRELAHATRPGGKADGPEFWTAFERAIPLASQQKRLLDEAGRHVWMGDVR
jgi:predicted metal-dependent hydrolase